jgi:hypothetical protein
MRSVRLVPRAISRLIKNTSTTSYCVCHTTRVVRLVVFLKNVYFFYDKRGRKTADSPRTQPLCILLLPHSVYQYDSWERSITSSVLRNNNYIAFVRACPVVLPRSSIVCAARRLSQIVFITVVGIIKQTILKSTVLFLTMAVAAVQAVAARSSGSAGTAPPHPCLR